MNLDVEVQSDDRLRRRVWNFSYSGGFLILRRFANDQRPSSRHGWRTVSKWESDDERSYNSNLKRPESIPAWVVEEALAKLPPPVATIGWAVEKFRATITAEPKECG